MAWENLSEDIAEEFSDLRPELRRSDMVGISLVMARKSESKGILVGPLKSKSERNRKYRLANKEKIKAIKAAYNNKNKEINSLKHKLYYQKNREACLERNKRWREANPERMRALLKAWKQKRKLGKATADSNGV